MTFEIEVDRATLERSQHGGITGQLVVRVDGKAFPGERWSDFPIVVLGWWLGQVANLLSGSSEASCRFMDGPFAFDLRDRRGGWLIQLRGPQPVAEAFVSRQDVIDSLARAAETINEECEQRGWSSTDLSVLANRWKAMKAAAAGLRRA